MDIFIHIHIYIYIYIKHIHIYIHIYKHISSVSWTGAMQYDLECIVALVVTWQGTAAKIALA